MAYTLRITALYRGWEEKLAPTARVCKHDDRRPLIGRKIAEKSQRKLRNLGVFGEDTAQVSTGAGTI